MTLRDDAWNTAIRTIVEQGGFKLTDLGFKDSERSTARRVLREMEEHGWLVRDATRPAFWNPGPTAKELLKVPEPDQPSD